MAVKSTEITIDVAPIGIINVPVNNVRDVAFRMLSLPDNVRCVPQGKQIVAFEKREAIIKV